MGDSVQPRKYIALGMFAVTVSIFASKRASIHLPKLFWAIPHPWLLRWHLQNATSPGWNVSGWQLHRWKSPALTLQIHIIWKTKILRWWGFGSLSTWFASAIRYLHPRISQNFSLQTKIVAERQALWRQITGAYNLYHYLARLSEPSAQNSTHIIIYFCYLWNPQPATSINISPSWQLLDPAHQNFIINNVACDSSSVSHAIAFPIFPDSSSNDVAGSAQPAVTRAL